MINSVLKIVQGWMRIRGNTDNTLIGNNGDRLKVENVSTDIFTNSVSGSRYNQIEVFFQSTPDTNVITNSTSNGGTVTQANGHTLYSSGTNTSASAKGVSVQNIAYRPAYEIYSYFTASFTTPTSANSYQRIGLYDTDNGFFIGFEGTTFGITKRTATIDTFVGRTSFNGDLLDGSASSKFTRNGTPEAINLTYSNLFRIRFGWLGSASILFEVFCPDGFWVVFHTLKIPNSQLNPSVTNPDLPMTIDVSKTSADATNLIMTTACWGAGTTSPLEKITSTLNDYTIAALTRSVITGRASTGGGTYYNVKVTPSGSLTVALGDISGVVGQNTMANSLPVTIASNQSVLPVSETFGVISTSNSTTTPLAGSATYTGTWEDVTVYAASTVIANTDVAGTLYADFSTDSTNVDRTVQLSDGTSGSLGIHALVPVARYFRVRLVNGASAQSYLRLQTIHDKAAKISIPTSRFTSPLTDYTDVINTRAGVVGKYSSSLPTLTDGQRSDLQLDVNGRAVVSLATPVRSYSTGSLSAGASYTSPTFDTNNGQSYLSYSAFSVTDLTVVFEESDDSTNWFAVDYYAVAAGDSNYSSHRISARYGRIKITNGTVANAGGVTNLAIACKLDTIGTEGDVQIADKFGRVITADPSWGLRVKTAEDVDAFGASITSARITQISANFSQALTYNDVTSTTTSTGTVTQANGSVVIASGTGTTSTASLVTNSFLSYTPGHELYAIFTAAFTTPTSSASNQRIGLYDASNGFFIGYQGTSFGVTWRQNGVDTFTAQASFNEDTLTGNVNSFFLRGASPEAIDPTKKNIFRIRYGWLGAAPVRFEVLSPEGRWVKFHTLRYPNTAVAPHTYNPNLPITCEVTKTASDATNLQISSSSWDGGITDYADSDLSYFGTITAVNGAVTTSVAGKSTVSVNILGTWVGTLVFEGHNGDLTWSAITAYTQTGIATASTTTNQFLYINSSAYTQVRVRASAWTSGTANVQLNASARSIAMFTQTEGNVQSGTTDAGNPMKVGGLAKTTQPTAVTDGQRANALFDKVGRQVVTTAHVRDLVSQQQTAITGTTETTIVTAVAATFNDLSTLVITNAANQATTVTIRDSTAGTTRAIFDLAANGGIALNLPVPWKQGAVNTNWTAQQTGTGTIHVFAIALQNI